ncbi:MAG: hypothetical protein WBG08_03290 [Litorimonas sp.]
MYQDHSELTKIEPVDRYLDHQAKRLDISNSSIVLLQRAQAEGMKIQEIVQNPKEVAERFKKHMDVGETAVEDLHRLGENMENMSEAERQVFELYAAIQSDGRHYHQWLIAPERVAEKVDVELSEEAAEIIRKEGRRMLDVGLGNKVDPGHVMSGGAIIVTIITLWTLSAAYERPAILDKSGLIKP